MKKRTFVVVLVALLAVFTVFRASSEAKVMELFEQFVIDVPEGWQVNEDKEANSVTFTAPDGSVGLNASAIDSEGFPFEDFLKALVEKVNGENPVPSGFGYTFQFEADGKASRAFVTNVENTILLFTLPNDNEAGLNLLQTFNMKPSDTYTMGSDKIASITAVLGEVRRVTDERAGGASDGAEYIQYAYESASMVKDLAAYSVYLQNNGWFITKSYDLNAGNGEMELATESADKGKILILSVTFEEGKYAIRITKVEGTLTSNCPAPAGPHRRQEAARGAGAASFEGW